MVYELLKNFLEWSRLERGLITPAPENFLITELVQMTTQLLAASAMQKQIQINNLITGQLSIYADPKMIQTVMRNLLSNAVKFTAAGGRIDVSAY
jgi:two-component system, sensor histidine kinase and response regulator